MDSAPTVPSTFLSFSRVRWWHVVAVLLAVQVLVPVFALALSWQSVDTDLWQHLLNTQLPTLLKNTLILVFGVAIGVIVLGVSLAWLVSMCEFPGRRWLDWALMMPLAIPAYVLAFVFTGFFDFAGPLQSTLKQWLPGYQFVDVRNSFGVITTLTLVLYPYVYMLARSAFLAQGYGLIEAARILGKTPRQAFFQVALPMARPAIAAGMALALMETLADFGAVSVFNYDTFTTAIYKAWYGLFSLETAAQLSTLLLLFVAVSVVVERNSRGSSSYAQSEKSKQRSRFVLTGRRALFASTFCGLVFALAFLLPIIQLTVWVVQQGLSDMDARYLALLRSTIGLGAVAASVTVTGALLLAYAKRLSPSGLTSSSATIATLGYALPGSVLAVGIMMVFGWLDRHLVASIQESLDLPVSQWFLGGLLVLVLAYCIRFMAVAFGPVESSLERIRPSIQEAARSLGASHWQVLTRVYLPMLTPGILTGLLMVLVDVMKEMPATLLMRPFGWDTLAVRIYELTSEGEWERAALPALTLVLVGLGPVILLMRRSVTH